MEPRELLLADICKPQNLKPVRKGKLLVGARRSLLEGDDTEYVSDEDTTKSSRKVIKPIAAFQVSTDDSDSYFSESEDDEERQRLEAPDLSPLSPVDPERWHREVTKDIVSQPSSCRQLSRRHTISSCDRKNGKKHKWQNPIECLSLTLEEITHIRMVLTKAELESLITDRELYAQLSKAKVCFTCKKTKFSLFGQWGTKCNICQRTVCNYCLKKMSVPTEHFEKIPVYTLSPVPISPEVLEALKVYESTGSVPHSPVTTRKQAPKASPKEEPSISSSDDSKIAAKRRTLQRSHTIGTGSRPPPKALLKGPQMSICCDCKSMIMEIIRASRSSVSIVPNSESSEQRSITPTDTSRGNVMMRSRKLDIDDKPRPRSMLASFNFKSFNFITKTDTDA